MSGADSIRVMCPLFHAGEGGATPTSALQLLVESIDTERALELNRLWHSRLPLLGRGAVKIPFPSWAATFNGVAYAVAIWSNPVARLLPQKEWLELRRLAIAPDAPRNTASRMLAVMARLIHKSRPWVTTLVSYQDCEVHTGAIYRAAGWVATAEHAGGSWDSPNSRNRCGTKRTRPDMNGAVGPKQRWEKRL